MKSNLVYGDITTSKISWHRINNSDANKCLEPTCAMLMVCERCKKQLLKYSYKLNRTSAARIYEEKK